ncbi:BCCT, betaine/carnitine/choline family transporter [Xylophilus ampelinus]|uniref:BCCT, betaine/carnitine/choline family transporter n=1 Tax=Xylophilus ampelinus TaxID=54067 RepID=A0A318SFQ7_9BURK|nr:BCCT, betaine/carnitine/choline family transporter [Xylophilus ampelinus]
MSAVCPNTPPHDDAPPADTPTPFLHRHGPLLASMAIIATVVVWGLAAPAALDRFFGGALASITRNFGWLYLWVVLGLVLLALFLAASRYGDLKLGDEDDEPEFSVGAWSRCCSPRAWASGWCSGVWPNRSRTT